MLFNEMSPHGTETRYIRGYAALVTTTLIAAACSSPTKQETTTRESTVATTRGAVKGDTFEILLESATSDDAIDSMGKNGVSLIRGSRFVRADATSDPIAIAPGETMKAAALVDALKRFGAAFVPRGEEIPKGVIQIYVAKQSVPFERGPTTGTIVFLRQRFGNFEGDQFIGGVFVANNLISIGGAIHDPASTPATTGEVAISTESLARDAFIAKAGSSIISSSPIRGIVWSATHRPSWVWGKKTLDAESGELADLDLGTYDSFQPVEDKSP